MNTLSSVIKDELNIRKRHYLEAPSSIVEHYNMEQENIQSYNGRQLLEMLQNADDASEIATRKSVLIELDTNQLVIANNGEAFSEGGFRSIIYSNLSPKTMLQNKIGQKGLGFRSILSWADEVVIESGGTKLAFSESIAHEFLDALIAESATLPPFLEKLSKAKYPIATLRVPRLLEASSESSMGYDTIISIKLKPGIAEDVLLQIASLLNKETLVFLNHIETIDIISFGNRSTYRKSFNLNSVTVTYKDFAKSVYEEKTWYVKKKHGKHKDKNYEVAIAWNDDLDDTENLLFSYFKTQVRFPFPALVHGTFELTPDRNQITKDTEGHNKYLTQVLVDLLIETSKEIAFTDPAPSYKPLKLLNIDFERVDTVMLEFCLKDTLTQKIRETEIFPCVSGRYICHKQQPVSYDVDIARYLGGDDCTNLMIYCDEASTQRFVSSLTNYVFTLAHVFKMASRRACSGEFNIVAKLLHLLLNVAYYKDKLAAADFDISKEEACFVDDEMTAIPWDSIIFIRPLKAVSFDFPKNVNLRFINSELVASIMKEFEKHEIPEIVSMLVSFQVKTYDFLQIASTLINYFTEAKPSISTLIDLHFYLYRLYANETSTNILPQLPDGYNVPVITQNRKLSKSKNVYFGKIYGFPLTEQLYSYDKSKILASCNVFRLGNENLETIKGYFRWLGVEHLPRYKSRELWRGSAEFTGFEDHALRNFDFKKPLEMGTSYKTYQDLISQLKYVTKIVVASFDGMEKILKSAKPEHIFQWIKDDNRLRATLETDCEYHSESLMQLDITALRYYRHIRSAGMRSYTRWVFSRTPWLPVDSVSLIAPPGKCCLSKTISAEFSPYVEKPNVQIAKLSDRLGLPEDIIEGYLVLVGVHRDISTFPVGVLYEMLFSLNSTDIDGKVAKSIYREVINNYNESKIDVQHPAYVKFKAEGTVLCQKGNSFRYVPVAEAYYIDTKTIGNNILSRFPLICVDRKRGKKKVERVFGVQPLDQIGFKVLEEPVLHKLSKQLDEEIQRFKALVYVLRMHLDTKYEIRNRLKRLHIALVSEIKAEFSHKGLTESFELEPYEFIVTKNKSHFQIKVPYDVETIEELRETIPFNECIAEIFTTLMSTEEHRSFIRELFSTREMDRELLLLSEIQEESGQLITEAKKRLDIIDDLKLSFWRSFALSSKLQIKSEIKNHKDLHDFFVNKLKLSGEKIVFFTEDDTYSQFNELSVQEEFYDIFLRYRADYSSFLRHFSAFDLSYVLRDKFEDCKRLYADEFCRQLYIQLQEGEVAEKSQFFRKLDIFNDLSLDHSTVLDLDMLKHLTALVSAEFGIMLVTSQIPFDVSKLIDDAIAALSANGVTIPPKLIEKKPVQSLLVFREFEQIKKIVDSYIKSNTGSGNSSGGQAGRQVQFRKETISFTNYSSLAKRILELVDPGKLKLKNSSTSTTAVKGTSGGKAVTRSISRKVRFDPLDNECIGFISELLCYHSLCEKFGEDAVKWVSENGSRAYPCKFMTGEAGKGYDIEIHDKVKGKTRFLEVKGTSNILGGIHMSATEIKTALEYPDKYDLIIVEDPLSENPSLRHIKSAFKFKKPDTLLSNERFQVFNDSYLVKFTWND